MSIQVIQPSEDLKNTAVFDHPSFKQHEQIVFCQDEDTGLKAIIGIHNTVLGPAMGGTRMWDYSSSEEALNDVLRLSRGMTYKSAVAGLNLGGGKAVIIGDAKQIKDEALLKRFAEFVDSLSGKYYTAEDVGMETQDMDLIKSVTPYVTGVSESLGGAGNPSPITAFGVYQGMKAACKRKFGSDDLKGLKILVQGVGHVGEALVEYLYKEKADLFISDINQAKLEELSSKFGAKIIATEEIFNLEMDVYAPCALGATLNDDSIDKLSAKVVAGAANNQLADEFKHAKMLEEKDILYAPDFVVNAGGIINVYAEIAGFSRDEIMQKTKDIYQTTLNVIDLASAEAITTHEAAMRIAEERIMSAKSKS